MNSSKGINPINFKFWLCNLKALTMEIWAICEFSSMGMSVIWRWKFMFRHETVSFYNFSVHAHICTRIQSSTLNTSICKYSFKVIAPPTGNKKIQISPLYVLRTAGWPHPPQNSPRRALIHWCCEACEFSCNSLSEAWWQSSMLRLKSQPSLSLIRVTPWTHLKAKIHL